MGNDFRTISIFCLVVPGNIRRDVKFQLFVEQMISPQMHADEHRFCFLTMRAGAPRRNVVEMGLVGIWFASIRTQS